MKISSPTFYLFLSSVCALFLLSITYSQAKVLVVNNINLLIKLDHISQKKKLHGLVYPLIIKLQWKKHELYTNTIIRMQEQKGSHDEHFTNHNQQKMKKERTETVKIPPVTAENEIIGP